MNDVVSTLLPDFDAATALASRLRERGVPERAITIEDQTPAHGLNLGAGITSDALDVVIDQHDAERAPSGYVVRVATGGDFLNEAAAREVFGYLS